MTKLCPRGKSAAKRKFKVYPSAYANAYASKICAGKIKDPSGMKRKDWGPKKMSKGGGADMSTIEVKKNKKPMPGDPDKRRKYMIDIQNPYSEYDEKGKLIYTAASQGKIMANGGRIGFNKGGEFSENDLYLLKKFKYDPKEVATHKDGGRDLIKSLKTVGFNMGGRIRRAEGKIMQVANKLEKASKAHAGQAKTLKSLKLSRDGGMIDMTKMKYV
jgi:hypothetical protein